MSILVIDAGTTNIKVLIFDRKGNIIKQNAKKVKTHYPEEKWVEQKASDWWNCFVKGLEEIDYPKEKIEAISTSTQGGTFLPLDENLKPLRKSITWLDNRAERIAKSVEEKYGKNFFYHKTGHFISGWSPPAVILWLKKNEKETYKKMKRLSFVPDYINWKLTGNFFLDQTSAGMTFFYNIEKGKWDREIMGMCGIDENYLPEIVEAGKEGGKVKKEVAKMLGIKEGIPVISGGHDQYCACYGAGVKKEGDCLLSCGTAWALLVVSNKLIFKENTEWRPGRFLKDEKFGLMAAISNGGCVIDWVRKNFKLKKQINLKEVKNCSVSVNTLFNQGKGEIKKLSLSTTPEEIYFATLKSLVNQVNNHIEKLKKNPEVKKFFLVGGGTKEKMLPDLVKEITGINVIIPEITESAAKGAFLLAKEGIYGN